MPPTSTTCRDGRPGLFTVRQIEIDDDEFARDVAAVAADLERLAVSIQEGPR